MNFRFLLILFLICNHDPVFPRVLSVAPVVTLAGNTPLNHAQPTDLQTTNAIFLIQRQQLLIPLTFC